MNGLLTKSYALMIRLPRTRLLDATAFAISFGLGYRNGDGILMGVKANICCHLFHDRSLPF